MSDESGSSRILPPTFAFRLVAKSFLVMAALVGLLVALAYFVAVPKLAEQKITEMETKGFTESALVSKLALSSMFRREPEILHQALDDIQKHWKAEGMPFAQISVILNPGGEYYSSTVVEYRGAKAHPSLMAKILEMAGEDLQVNRVVYQDQGKTRMAVQVLQNIRIDRNDEKVLLATTQVILGYDQLLAGYRSHVLLMGAGVMLLLLLTVILALAPVSMAVVQLMKALNQVKNRNFSTFLPLSRKDELGMVFGLFNQTLVSLRKYFEDLQASTSSVQFKEPSTSTTTPHGDVSLRKAEITCLCTRIPNLQEKIEAKKPEEVAEYLGEFIQNFERIIQDNGGHTVKILGDKIFSIFEGLTSVNNSIRCAIQLNSYWEEVNHERKVLNKPTFNFGVGLHSGTGIAGTFGHRLSHYTFLGEAGAVADYLCSCARQGEVLVTSSMLEKASDRFTHQVVTDPRAVEMAGLDEVLSITEKVEAAPDKSNRDQKNLYQKGFSKPQGPLPSRLGHTFESSIPDMLEETLEGSPLETRLDKISREEDQTPAPDPMGDMEDFSGEVPEEAEGNLWENVSEEEPKGQAE